MDTSVDFVIVGGGIAGLRGAAALASRGRVLILSKADTSESNTGYAQGGIAAAVGSGDSPSLHARDTIRAGDGLCDESAVDVLVGEGPRYVRELIEWGARFDHNATGELALALEAAHSVRRVLHAGDTTGREIGRVLWSQVVTLPTVTIVQHALVTDLITRDGRVHGVRFFDGQGRRRAVEARSTLLATGGAGQIFRETTNPAVATGDGVALAWYAGACLADLEFVQFHPTALCLPGAPRFLISEAIRGEGGRLINAAGEAFMAEYHPDGDLAPRDVVARSIVTESRRTQSPVFLSLAHLDPASVTRRFPMIAEMCRQLGLDLATDRLPVGPAAHYLMGGVVTDVSGRTSLPGLFAAGETACTGVHGANRLASNSLLEGLVFGARVAEAMTSETTVMPVIARRGWRMAEEVELRHEERESLDLPTEAVRDMMWSAVGLSRSRADLETALSRLQRGLRASRRLLSSAIVPDVGAWRHYNLLTVARLIARAALRRQESRGGHFREDFPARNDQRWGFHAIDVRDIDEGL